MRGAVGNESNKGAKGGHKNGQVSAKASAGAQEPPEGGEGRFRVEAGDLARMFEVSIRTLRRWMRKDQFPKTREGVWDIRDVVAFLRKRAEDLDRREGLDDEQRLARAKADLAELAVAERRGQLMPKDAVRTSCLELWGRVRQIIEAVQRQCDRSCGRSIGELFESGLNELDALVKRQKTSAE